MANLNDTPQWPDVYQLEQSDPVVGGAPNPATGAGMDNIPHLQLAQRTSWLRAAVTALQAATGAASATVAGIVKLSGATNSTATDTAASSAAVKAANDNAETRALRSTIISANGLATGGGSLGADRTINVPVAMQAQAQAGSDNATAVTPLRVAQFFAALGLPSVANLIAAVADTTAVRPIATGGTGANIAAGGRSNLLSGTALSSLEFPHPNVIYTGPASANLLADPITMGAPWFGDQVTRTDLGGGVVRWTPSAVNAQHLILQDGYVAGGNWPDNTVFTQSIELRAQSGANFTWANFLARTKNPSFDGAYVNLTTGEVVAYGSPINLSATVLPDGFVRVVYSFNSGVGGSMPTIGIYLSTSNEFAGLTFVGSGTGLDIRNPIVQQGAAIVGRAVPATPAQLQAAVGVDRLLPAGMVGHFAMTTAPAGWLKANGALVSRTTFANLFAAIGTIYGTGDGSTTFALPDLRGEFLRSWDDMRNVDAGRVFGSSQADEFRSHTHAVSHSTVSGVSSGGTIAGGSPGANTATTTTSAGGAETRPRNIALLACIKF